MNDLPEVNVMLHDFIHHDRDPEAPIHATLLYHAGDNPPKDIAAKKC